MRRAVAEKDGKVQYSLRRWRYDIHNNIVAEKTWLTMQSATSASGLARTIWREYDAQNRCLRVTDSLGAEVRYTYNSIGKRTSETRKISGEETQYIKYAYDAAGRLLERAEKSNPKRNRKWWATTSYTYDADSRKENYAYDFAGNITEAVDDNGNIRKYAYDDNNQLKSITYPDGSQEQYLFTADGKLIQFQDRNGITNEYQWNVYGSLVERKAGDLCNSYEYAPNGQLIAAIAGDMDYRYTYDKDGLLTDKKASGRTLLAYTYDELGRKTSQTDITGRKVNYRFDKSNHLVVICNEADQSIVKFDRDADGAI